MRQPLGIAARIAVLCLVLSGCDKPSIQRVFVSAAEDTPKVITADVVPTSNMEVGATAELTPVAPANGAGGQVSMTQTTMVGAQARFEGSVPLGAKPVMAYGTQWQATVSIPYSVFWRRQVVTSSTKFIVAAAASCVSFDGDLAHEGWPQSTQVRSSEAGRADVNAVITHLPQENARPSLITGALSITIPELPKRMGNEIWSTRFIAGGTLADWTHATALRVAIKSSDSVFVRAGLLVNRGVVEGNPATPVLEWVYTQNKPIDGGQWQLVELPFPTFPAPMPGSEKTALSSFTINFDAVRPEMQIMIDDICPVL